MPNLTPEEKKVILFLFAVAFCGIALNNLAKANCKVKKLFSPHVQLAKIDLNRISLEELLRTKCLPEKISRGIIDYRLKHGGFSSLEALKEVKGIGEKRFNKLKELFYVE